MFSPFPFTAQPRRPTDKPRRRGQRQRRRRGAHRRQRRHLPGPVPGQQRRHHRPRRRLEQLDRELGQPALRHHGLRLQQRRRAGPVPPAGTAGAPGAARAPAALGHGRHQLPGAAAGRGHRLFPPGTQRERHRRPGSNHGRRGRMIDPSRRRRINLRYDYFLTFEFAFFNNQLLSWPF